MDCTPISATQIQTETATVSLMLRVLSTDSTSGWAVILAAANKLPAGNPLKTLIGNVNGVLSDNAAKTTIANFQALASTLSGVAYNPPECCGVQTGNTLLPIPNIKPAMHKTEDPEYR